MKPCIAAPIVLQVNLRRLNIGVTKQAREAKYVAPICQVRLGERVAEGMRAKSNAINACFLSCALDGVPHSSLVEGLSSNTEEYSPLKGSCRLALHMAAGAASSSRDARRPSISPFLYPLIERHMRQ